MKTKRSGICSLAALAVLLAAVVVVAQWDTAKATYNPTMTASVSDTEAGANADVTTSFNVPTGDFNYDVLITFTPPEFGMGPGDVPLGAHVADLQSDSTLGLLNNVCITALPVSFTMLKGTTNTADTISFDDGFADLDGNTLPDGVDKYPDFLNTMFPDLTPLTRSYGQASVAGTPVSMNLVVFEPATAFPGLPAFDASLGYASVSVLNDPTAELEPGSITDFCTPLATDTTTYGISKDNPETAVDESGYVVSTNPTTGGDYTFTLFSISQGDADGDGIENDLDTCPFDVNEGDPRVQGDGDPDNDGLDNACDPEDDVANTDQDDDVYLNRGDNCPLVSNPDNADADGDRIGDACDTEGNGPDTPDGEGIQVTVTAMVTIPCGPVFPTTFAGTVTVGGEPAPDGTVIWAIGSDEITWASTTTSGGSYNMDVPATMPVTPPCFPGGTISFQCDGTPAAETGEATGGLKDLDLTCGPLATITVTVNSTGDSNARDGVLTLREAILLANGALAVVDLDAGECGQLSNGTYGPPCSSTGTIGAASADTIDFDAAVFPIGTPATITLGSILPTFSTHGDTVDGASAGVIIDGDDKSFDCFEITSGGNTIKGLEIYNCMDGIWIHSGASSNTIGGTAPGERNVISGNDWDAVVIVDSGTDGNVVKGNYIGTDASGSTDVANGAGVWIGGGAQNNTIGGTAPGDRNVISGNDLGVFISADNNVVKGNYIGTDATGAAPLANGIGVGIAWGTQGNTIGGTAPGDRNVISGNDWGVFIADSETDSNVVKGNYIGTDATGAAPLANGIGVDIVWGAQGNTIGGSAPGERNVISGNDWGVVIRDGGTDSNVVKGNYIGTDASGSTDVANGAGVWIGGGAQNNTIGGSSPGERNVIAYNAYDGVRVDGATTTGNTIRGNSIHSNDGKGIENSDGGNTELAPPTITGIGSVSGTACAFCWVEVFSDDDDEGRMFLLPPVQADEFGDWVVPGYPIGPNVTATATDADGSTSEFSAPFACGSDSDGDNIGDACDPAPGSTNADADGFDDYVEAYIGTDPLDDCPDDVSDDAWPPDITIDTVVDIFDALTFLAAFPSAEGSPNYSQRLDFSPDGVIDIFDALTFLAYFPSACTNP